jgi:Holliday junction resolvase
MRRAARRDNNERDLLDAFAAAGWLTIQTSVKDGPDFFACSPCGTIVGVEAKNPTRKARPDYVSAGQVAWHDAWSKRGAPVFVIETIAQVEECIRLVINRRGERRMESTP